MRGALGNSLLLYIIVAIVAALAIIFSSVLAYSKAYRVKNRIISVIEKYEEYNTDAENEISASLIQMGYRLGSCDDTDDESVGNNTGYKYCVSRYESSGGYYYKVTTYVQFYFPLIQELMSAPVTGETKILGKSYDY